MISFAEAKQIIRSECVNFRMQDLPLIDAVDHILAENLYSKINTPPFDQSAMDGYAFKFETDLPKKLEVHQEVQAGMVLKDKVMPGFACRIFTGAPLPEGTDTVIIQEKTELSGSDILLKDEQLKKGQNVRLKGSQTRSGSLVLKEGTLITPAGISFIAGLGISEVKVFGKPKVSVLVTGNELQQPGKPLGPGQIYESNSFALISALRKEGIMPVFVGRVEDDEKEIENSIKKALIADIVLITGGVSVGDYDFVSSTLKQLGVQELFHKVKQKPGKPLFFGKQKKSLIFGLPGNPASVMTGYYMYVLEAIKMFSGTFEKDAALLKILTNGYIKRAGFVHFLKGKTNGEKVSILNGQESYLMNSFAEADCLVFVGEDTEELREGDKVKIFPI